MSLQSVREWLAMQPYDGRATTFAAIHEVLLTLTETLQGTKGRKELQVLVECDKPQAGSFDYSLTFTDPKGKGHSVTVAVFSTLEQAELLESQARARILNLVREHPGLGLGELARLMQRRSRAMEYHVAYLERKGLIAVHRHRGKRGLFRPDVSREEAEGIMALRGRNYRRLHASIVAQPGISVGNLATAVGLSKRVTQYHLRKLADAGLVKMLRGSEFTAWPVARP